MSLFTQVKERISHQLVDILDLDEDCQSCICNMLQKPKDSSKGEYCLNIQKLVHTCGKCDKLNSNQK